MSLVDNNCDHCGASPLTTGVWDVRSAIDENYYASYRPPEQYESLCGDCFRETNTHTVDDLSDDELVAAIIDDSIGYASPAHAARHVEEYHAGEDHCYCERGSAVFNNDLEALMESARAHWLRLSDGKQANLLKVVEGWKAAEKEGGYGASMGLSLSYPTMNIPEEDVE